MKKAHGKHNRDLCDELYQGKQYNDWVITTAFYSAIHYIDHCLFPLTHNGVPFQNISQIHRVVRRGSPHKTRDFIVGLYMPNSYANYGYLSNACWNARYKDYRVGDAEAQLAKDALEEIISECLTTKP